MKIEKLELLRNVWYKNRNVMMNIIPSLMQRETVFMQWNGEGQKNPMIRPLKIFHDVYFYKCAERYHFLEKPFNLYSSIALYPQLPRFSFSRKEHDKEREEFNKNAMDLMRGYDLFIDIDNRDLELSYSTAVRVKAVFDDYKIPYYLLPSGNKGFHFRVPYDSFPKQYKEMNYAELINRFKRFAEVFSGIYAFYDNDISIFDSRRIAKVPYSVSMPLYTVALPLSDEEFEKFRLKHITLPYLITRMDSLFKRRYLQRHGNPQGLYELVERYQKK